MASIAPMSTQKQEDSLSPVFPALEELAAKTQWVVYCLEPDKTDPTRLTKVPSNARTGYRASTTNPKHWSTFAQAVKALKNAHNVKGKRFSGIGFVFCGDYTGIDFDHCIDEQGTIDGWAKSEIEHLHSYSEISQSGEGVHVIVRGLLPEQTNGKGETSRPGKKVMIRGERHEKAAIEMYCEGRFFVMTGKHVEGTPTTIRDGLPQVQALYDRLTTQRSTPSRGQDSDDALLEMASRNGRKFHALFWEGDTSEYGGDESAADQALCNYLAFYTRGDTARMDRLFRRSALMRAKWDRAARNGETYGQGTIRRAILDAPFVSLQGCHYMAEASNGASFCSIEPGRRFSDIQEKEIEWFWEKWIPQGKITMLDAMPDQGKSVLCTTLAASASTGANMPDGSRGIQGAVIMVNLEDDAADTVKPRLLAAHADVSQVIDLSSIRTTSEDGELVERPFQIPRDLPLLEEQIVKHGVVLVCLDPLMAILDSSLKSANDQDVRQALTPLARMLERTRSACLIVRHFNKGSSENALIRGAGSMGIVGAARSQLFVTPDPDNAERHILALGKHNLSTGASNLIYRIVSDEICRPRIQWEGTSSHSTAELLSTAKTSGGRQEILRILRDAEKPLGALEIVEKASNLTYEQARQLLSRMSKAGEIVSISRGLYTLSQSSQLSQPSQVSQLSQIKKKKKNFSDCDRCGNDCDSEEECHNQKSALEANSDDIVTNVTDVTPICGELTVSKNSDLGGDQGSLHETDIRQNGHSSNLTLADTASCRYPLTIAEDAHPLNIEKYQHHRRVITAYGDGWVTHIGKDTLRVWLDGMLSSTEWKFYQALPVKENAKESDRVISDMPKDGSTVPSHEVPRPETCTNYPYDVIAWYSANGLSIPRIRCLRNHSFGMSLPWYNSNTNSWEDHCEQCYPALRETSGRSCYFD